MQPTETEPGARLPPERSGGSDSSGSGGGGRSGKGPPDLSLKLPLIVTSPARAGTFSSAEHLGGGKRSLRVLGIPCREVGNAGRGPGEAPEPGEGHG